MAAQWELALEQCKDLGVIHGTIAATAEAVRQGADLRLFLIARGYEETLYFQQTYAGAGDAFAGLEPRKRVRQGHNAGIEQGGRPHAGS